MNHSTHIYWAHGQRHYFITQTFMFSLSTWHTVPYVTVNKCCWLTNLRWPGDLNGQKNNVISPIIISIIISIIFICGELQNVVFKVKWLWAGIVQVEERKFWAAQQPRKEEWKWAHHPWGPEWTSFRYCSAAAVIVHYFWLFGSWSCWAFASGRKIRSTMNALH